MDDSIIIQIAILESIQGGGLSKEELVGSIPDYNRVHIQRHLQRTVAEYLDDALKNKEVVCGDGSSLSLSKDGECYLRQLRSYLEIDSNSSYWEGKVSDLRV